jgi:hypothetical protein
MLTYKTPSNGHCDNDPSERSDIKYTGMLSAIHKNVINLVACLSLRRGSGVYIYLNMQADKIYNQTQSLRVIQAFHRASSHIAFLLDLYSYINHSTVRCCCTLHTFLMICKNGLLSGPGYFKMFLPLHT